MDLRFDFLLIAFLTLFLPSHLFGVPETIAIQGQLNMSSGEPLSGSRVYRVQFYDAPTGGNAIGGPLTGTVTIIGSGRFTIEPILPDGVLEADSVYYELAIDSSTLPDDTLDAEDIFQDRIKVHSVPFAIRATLADQAATADHALTADTSAVADRAHGVMQIVRDYVVASGHSVSAGDVVAMLGGEIEPFDLRGELTAFNTVITQIIKAATLSSDRFVVVYADGHDNLSGKAIVGQVSGTSVSFGPVATYNIGQTFASSVSVLTPDKFVVAFNDVSNSNAGTAVVGQVSDLTISLGSETVFHPGVTNAISTSRLSDSSFVVSFADEGLSGRGSALVCLVTGTTITFGAESVYVGDGVTVSSIAVLAPDRLVVAFEDFGSFPIGAAAIGSIDGASITFAPSATFVDGRANNVSTVPLSAGKFVVAFRNDSTVGSAVVGDVAGDRIHYGPLFNFSDGNASDIAAAPLSSDRFVIAFEDSTHGSMARSFIGRVFGRTIQAEQDTIVTPGFSGDCAVAVLSSDKHVVIFRDFINSDYGTAVVFGSNPLGIAAAGAADGQSVPVIIGGISDVHEGLVPDSDYYAGDEGILTRDSHDAAGDRARIGKALSPSEMLLQLNRN